MRISTLEAAVLRVSLQKFLFFGLSLPVLIFFVCFQGPPPPHSPRMEVNSDNFAVWCHCVMQREDESFLSTWTENLIRLGAHLKTTFIRRRIEQLSKSEAQLIVRCGRNINK